MFIYNIQKILKVTKCEIKKKGNHFTTELKLYNNYTKNRIFLTTTTINNKELQHSFQSHQDLSHKNI